MRRNVWIGRICLFAFGAILIIGGTGTLSEGRIHYSNYWGGAVFAPLAIAIGLFVWGFLAFKWKTLDDKEPRLRGRAARKARQAERTRFPVDDFDKPWNP